eukprot:gene9871-biopygen12265
MTRRRIRVWDGFGRTGLSRRYTGRCPLPKWVVHVASPAQTPPIPRPPRSARRRDLPPPKGAPPLMDHQGVAG